MANGVAAGIYCAELDFSWPSKRPEYSVIFHTEVFAVRKAAQIANNAGNNTNNINTDVGSQTID